MHYPLFVELQDKKCLVIGGASVAERKVQGLLEYGAKVTVISPELTPTLTVLVQQRQISYIARCYQTGDLEGFFLVFCAVGQATVNQAVAAEAKRFGTLLNVVDQPNLCDFIVPATLRRGDLQISVSTSGTSPMLAKILRQDLEQQYGDAYAWLTAELGKLRNRITSSSLTLEQRKTFWLTILAAVLPFVQQGQLEQAKHALHDSVNEGWEKLGSDL